jgi:uncharacterized protein (TIGR02118 family)
MVRVHIWVRKRPDMSAEEFGRRWLERHAPIARDGYEHLVGYTVDLVTRVPQGQEAPYDGVATLTWEDRDGFKADLSSDAAARATEDLREFSEASGLLYVEEHVVR